MADKTEKKSKGFFAGVKRFFGRIGEVFPRYREAR